MIKRYLAKIIAKDSQGLQLISAYCAGAKVKITEIKYLPKNKIFLLSLERLSKESDNNNFKINSICKFEFVDSVKSKNVNQNNLNLALELNAENHNMYCATSLPGSPLYMKAKQEGWELPDKYSEFGFLSYDHIPSRTYSLESKEVLAFRDYAFHTCFENPRYLSMVNQKFGPKAVEHIKRLTNIKLKRRLLS